MGRNNQQRRAAKARSRAKASSGSPAGASFGTPFLGDGRPTSPSVREQVSVWVSRAFDALEGSSEVRADAACDEIVALAGTADGRRVVTRTMTEVLVTYVGHAWQLGWQPVDLARVVARRLGSDAEVVVADGIAAQLERYAVGTLAPRWPGQLREIGAQVWWSADVDPVDARATKGSGGLLLVVPLVVRVAHLLTRLPELERHDPLPGTAQPVSARTLPDAIDERILSRVRALLAKAESTTFDAEAETFTAGAQALMARHSIDAAMLAAGTPTAGRPLGRRVWIDRPYEAPKVLLLDVVATANRCRTVWSKELGFVTIIGFDADIDATETIFTSLLVQANHSLSGRGRRSTRDGHSRTRAFRQTFLMAYADRIGERLRAVTDQETASALSRADGGREVSGRELVRCSTPAPRRWTSRSARCSPTW